jgi:hypothetical protein
MTAFIGDHRDVYGLSHRGAIGPSPMAKADLQGSADCPINLS